MNGVLELTFCTHAVDVIFERGKARIWRVDFWCDTASRLRRFYSRFLPRTLILGIANFPISVDTLCYGLPWCAGNAKKQKDERDEMGLHMTTFIEKVLAGLPSRGALRGSVI